MFGGSRFIAFECDRLRFAVQPYALVVALRREDLHQFSEHLLHFSRADGSDPIEDDAALGRKESIGTDVTRLPQTTTGKVAIGQRHRIAVGNRLARDLAQDDNVAGERRYH